MSERVDGRKARVWIQKTGKGMDEGETEGERGREKELEERGERKGGTCLDVLATGEPEKFHVDGGDDDLINGRGRQGRK